MKSNFNDCLTRLLKDEGGYTNDASDSGGATNFGITLKDYKLYINKNGTAKDVKDMSVNDAKRIYKAKYWDAINADSLPGGVDYTCFDYAVHSGVGRPRKALERFKSLQGTELIDAINNERMAFLKALVAQRPKDEKFMKGWTNRVTRVRNYSKYLSAHTPAPVYTAAGPGGGTVATVSVWLTLTNYLHTHPYVTAAIAGGIGLGVWGLIHYIRNRNV
jgi:lysozyme family protein